MPSQASVPTTTQPGSGDRGTALDGVNYGYWTQHGSSSVYFSNGGYFSAQFAQGASYYLIDYYLGFNIPSGSVINGIQVTIEESWSPKNNYNYSPAQCYDSSARLFKVYAYPSQTFVGADRGNNNGTSLNPIFVNYGGPTDLWGTQWSPADINSPNFGCAVQYNNPAFSYATVYVYSMVVTVYYGNVVVGPSGGSQRRRMML